MTFTIDAYANVYLEMRLCKIITMCIFCRFLNGDELIN